MRIAMTAAAMLLAAPAITMAAEPDDGGRCQVAPPADGDLKAFAAQYFRAAERPEIDALIACFADPDPALRDDFAFNLWWEAWDAKLLSVAQRRFAVDRLRQILSRRDGANGYLRPFAALALVPTARADRLDPWMSPAELHSVAESAALYMRDISDYRGFVPGEGWRHAVAHTSDIMLQLALNPRLERADADLLLGAIGAQVAPDASPYYVHGEAARLARPVLFLAKRPDVDDAAWAAWFKTLHPDDAPRWKAPYGDKDRLAAVHNSTAFASAVYVGAAESQDPQVRRLAWLAADLLRALN